ncbi:MAG: hypothetical protein M3416_01585 [Acidobacteriota bacterium]|nr:hypothetical protein [Acidobacteriota bacterium]
MEGAPGPDLPDLDESRRVRTSPEADAPTAPILADLPCLDCDPSGGGGGGASFPSDPYFATARTRPVNETGDPGVTLGSRNFNWGLPLVSLPGRAGLDLSLALHYNSLVWTKQGTSIQYNADHGTPGPGFQLGLPRLQARHLNSDTNAYAHVMVTPSGGRVELKQVGTASVYEARDGSFARLTFEGATPVVRTTDGTQYRFGAQAGAEWRCTQVKDRNGNYLSATYNAANGHLLTVTDTLGRVVSFNYNADGNLSTVTQVWGGAAHTYATFAYGTVALSFNFSGLTVFGAAGGASQPVLSSVTLSTNESYHFDYNSYGQVFRIRRKAPDAHELGRTTYAFNLSAAQTDCPRFTERREWAESWNGDSDGVVAAAEEAVTTYSQTNGAAWIDPDNGGQRTGTLVEQTSPDGTVHRQFSFPSEWYAGLPVLIEVWSGGVRRKWTSLKYTQDDTALTYAQNPRVVEANVYDGVNRRRTTVEYSAAFNLPWVVAEYAADAATVLRRTYFDYKWDAVYIDRRIIGLPFRHSVYDGAGTLMAKTEYNYDWGGELFADTPAAARQHDRTNYGPAFLAGRGNLSQTSRYDVTDPTNAAGTIQETKWRHNSTGSVLMERDHLWHQRFLDYADSFSDGVNRNTFAYPTKATDEDGYAATAQYNFDFGAVTRTHAPTSGTGAAVTYADAQVQHDAHGRIQRVTNLANGAYKRWVYDPTGRHVHTYETIKSTAQADEFHSWRVTDGAGRLRALGADHPGSAGGYTGRYFVHDRMGRLAQASNPTEMTSAWVPAGDDAAWVYTAQAYDWQGRPTQTTNPDGSTRVLTYGGCGCAGGEVTTAQDEHGRGRRLTKDALGRLAKVEELNWDETVYATTSYTYNVRDQLTRISQQGQPRTFEYDGHGRLWRKTTPEQGATTFTYNGDDTVNTLTDARGATTTYGYSARHLVTSVAYGVAAGKTKTWADTANVTYAYDAAGHRTSMTDGQGAAAYHYDSLGRMDWEERNFTALSGTTDPPAYRLTYTYNVGGELTSLTYPSQFGSPAPQVSYEYDEAGRASAVGGANYGGVTNYANTLRYRAFGALKAMTYANGRALSAAYDSRLRPTKWDVAGVQGYNYRYDYFGERTGRVTYAQSLYDATLDRSYEYDHLGRLTISHTGTEARAHAFTGQWTAMDGPYSHGYDYDPWGNLTRRYGWGGDAQGGSPAASTDLRYTYANNRRSNAGYTYDAAGNLASAGGQTFTYDAAGNQTTASATGLGQHYDGDGLRVKKAESGLAPRLYLRSGVLGGRVVAELSWTGAAWQWTRGYVYLGSHLLAVQQAGAPQFVHEDPVTKSKRVTDMRGAIVSRVESDPWGADTARSSNAAFQPRRFTSYERDANGSDDAMMRRYSRSQARFEQPDPYDGSYSLADPQSFNRYSYTQNDPVNFTDPSGLMMGPCYFIGVGGTFEEGWGWCDLDAPRGPGGPLINDRPGGGGGGETSPQNPIQPFDIPGILSELERLLSNPDCANFIKDILGRVSARFPDNPLVEGGDVLKIFDRISQGGGLIRAGGPGSAAGNPNYALGSFATNDARIQIGNYLPGGTVTAEEFRMGYNRSDAGVGLHESMHHAGRNKYYDEVLAEAVNARTGAPIQNSRGQRPTGNPLTDPYIYSQYWDAELKKHCK